MSDSAEEAGPLPEPNIDFFDDPAPSGRLEEICSPSAYPADDPGHNYHRVRIVNRTGRSLKIVSVGYGSSASPGMANRSALVHTAQEVMHSDEGLALQFEGGIIADGDVWEQPINPLVPHPTFSTWFALARGDDATPVDPAPAAPPPPTPPDAGRVTPPEVETVPIAVLALSNPMLGKSKINVGEGVMERWGHVEERAVPNVYKNMDDGSVKRVDIWGGSVCARAELHDIGDGAARWCFWLLSSDSIHRCLSFSVD
eukprot:Hpha_TRINITY_DN19273_c0_g1::TRINITY_DN19273_c0_g1_i1::g.194337::m.194337